MFCKLILNSFMNLFGSWGALPPGPAIFSTVGDLSFSWNVSGHSADAGAGTGPHATRDGSGLSFSDAEFQSMLSLGLLGTDAIANGFIYRTDAVRLAPDTGVAVLDLGYTRVGGDPATDEANRPVIAVSFEEISSGEVFTAVSVHFKSKGSIAQGDGNEDLGDGAGNSNGQRTREAQAVVDWLETDPTNSNDSDVKIHYSTVTDLAKFLGLSISKPLLSAE